MTQVTFWKSELFPWLRYCFSWYAWTLGVYLDRRHSELWIHLLPFSLRINYHWAFYVGNDPLGSEDDAVLYIYHLFHWRGRRIDLHVMVRPDGANCYHTHPATAYRLPLWGGYIEEVLESIDSVRGGRVQLPKPAARLSKKTIRIFRLSRIDPEYTHRLDSFLNGRWSMSLWFRGRITHPINLVHVDKDGYVVSDELARQES